MDIERARERMTAKALKKKKFVAGILEGKSVSKATTDAGYSVAMGRGLMEAADVKQEIANYLDKAGADLEKTCKRHAEALDAVKVNDNGDEIPDHRIRLNAVELNYKARKIMNPDNQVQANVQVNIFQQLSQAAQDRGLNGCRQLGH